MGVLDFLKTGVVKEVGSIIDNVFTNDEEKSTAKKQLTEVVLKSLNDVAAVQGEVIKTEMKGNWLQKSWRPLTMLVMVFILVCKWFGWTNADIPLELEVELMGLLKIGIGGYIGGRTLEKVATKVTENVDMPFLKKKNRK
tara:strand:+ start:194 stop:613 length:420 start_codon:yes stop_codon:yes gene_type:complete